MTVEDGTCYGRNGSILGLVFQISCIPIPALKNTLIQIQVLRLIKNDAPNLFNKSPPKIIDLSATQVNLLAHLHCWNITASENAQLFMDILT